MSVLDKISRWMLLPLSIVAILIGIGGFSFSALSANQVKIEETTGFDAFTPSEVRSDLWSASSSLERYIEFRETGQIQTRFMQEWEPKTYSSVRLVGYIPRWSARYSADLELFVPTKYRSQPIALLRDEIKHLNIRHDVATIQNNAAEIYLVLLIAGGSVAGLVLLLPKMIVVGRMIPLSRICGAAVREWRKLMVLASVVWAVLATWEINPNRSSEYAIIVGPFVLAITIYFLFLRQGEKE